MKALLLAAGAGLCWGVGELFTRSVLHGGRVGPVTAIAVRSLVALPVLWIACWWALSRGGEPRDWWRPDAETGYATLWKLVLGSGLIAGAGGMILFYISLKFGEVSRVKPVAFALAPTVAVLLGWLVLGEPMTAKKAVAVVLIISGVVLLTG